MQPPVPHAGRVPRTSERGHCAGFREDGACGVYFRLQRITMISWIQYKFLTFHVCAGDAGQAPLSPEKGRSPGGVVFPVSEPTGRI